ncbi:MAG: DUF2577 family protein [Fusobacteriaceae bacterium]
MTAEQKIINSLTQIVSGMLPANNLLIGSVVNPPPDLSVKFGEQIIPSGQLYCSNHLLPNYRRDFKLKGVIDMQHQDISELDVNYSASDMVQGGQGPHKHKLISSTASGTMESTGNYEHHGEMWWTNTLKAGDEILLAVVGQFYVVVDRIVKMPAQAIEEGA